MKPRLAAAVVVTALAAWSAAAAWIVNARGWTLYYGDAESHLNTARRVVDSRTPGLDQLGSPWLPLPHLALIPFAARDRWWRSGIAGAIPSAVSFVIAGAFLFALTRRAIGSQAAGVTAAALLALNPNVMYLQSIPMPQVIFFATLLALAYFTVRFRDTQSGWAVAGAALAALAGTLTRYEGWFLIPPVALFFLLAARRNGLRAAVVFGAIASLGPLAWLAYNWYWFGDALYFYRGPYSAGAIQGAASWPGRGNWKEAAIYFRAAAVWCTGPALRWMAAVGVLAALARRVVWPLVLLVLPGVFYVWSMHSAGSGTVIYLPDLPPHSYYNSRYGMVLVPFAAFAAAALVAWAPPRMRGWAGALLVAAATAPWLLHPSPDHWITWKESQVNSEARREWTRLGAEFLAPRIRPGDGIFTTFSDITGIYRTMGLPLGRTLTWDNEPQWMAAAARPDLFLREQWAVCQGGDPVQTAINRARRSGPNYELVKQIIVKGAPVLEIYRRSDENPVH